MNNIGNLISKLEKELLNLWKHSASNSVKQKVVFTDLYDLIFNLWEQKIITDSGISMDVLNSYYKIKKYRYLPEDDKLYPQAERYSESKIETLIKELQKFY